MKLTRRRGLRICTFLRPQIRSKSNKMMFFSGEDQVSMPFILIIDGNSNCKEVKIKLFKFLYPILNIPTKFTSKLDEYSGDEFYEKAYESVFEDSTFGEDELYEFLLINNRSSGEGCAN